MKLKPWHWIVGVPVALVALVIVATELNARRDAAAFQEQLRLARAEGIPTTPAEFAAMIPTATPAENAAPFYKD